MKKLAIYFHWPYCKSKCPYCDFYKKIEKNVDQEQIINSYIAELDWYRNFLGHRSICSVFFGGGTPSLIEPKFIEKLLNHITKLWKTEKNAEISLEANPNTDSTSLFRDLRQTGINRLSLGVQALNEADLKFLGRTHTLDDALKSIQKVLKIFDNHSMDLIYARPNQNEKDWLLELEKAVCFGFKHLSLYQLTIEEGTLFARKNITPLKEDKAEKMYCETVDFLRANGYPRYEVSNFAPKFYESVHNKCYWQGDDYIGIGESAHGRLIKNKKHLALVHPHMIENLSATERAEELIIMGLRLEKGIDKQKFYDTVNIAVDSFVNQDKLKDMEKQGFICNTTDSLYATDKGFPLLDKIIFELCS